MPLTDVFDIVFAAGVVAAAASLAGAALRVLSRAALMMLAAAVFGAAVAAWIAFALRQDRALAIAAAGLTVCVLVSVASLLLQRALLRVAQTDERLSDAQARLHEQIDVEAAARAAELGRTLARARADSISLLIEEERRIADKRRREFVDREREVGASLTEALNATQAQVEQRLAGWAQDLDRAAEVTRARIRELVQLQRVQLSEVELRLAADADRLAAESEDQRAALGRLRAELATAIEESMAAARGEVESHAAERRRALHELDERMRRRERELMERIEREEVEAVQRIRAGFEDSARRQIEQMERIVQRATTT